MSNAFGIGNGFGGGILGRPNEPPAGVEGSPAVVRAPDVRPMINPRVKQVRTITFGGTATNGDYSTTFTLPSGDEVVVTTTRTGGSPSSNSDLATQHAADIEATAALYGHVESAEADTATVVVTVQHPGIEIEFAHDAPSPGTLTSVDTVAADGTSLPCGRFVVASGETFDGTPGVELPDSTSTADDIVGVTMRPTGVLENSGDASPSALSSWPVGRMVDVAYEGQIFMRNVGGAAAADGEVHVVISTAGGDALGEARGDSDGVAQVTTLTPGAGQNSVEISVLITILTGDHAGKSLALSTLSDGSMTATEVCDAWRTIINADAFWSTLLTDSGTATLVLTSADPEVTFDVTNLQGTVTIAATTAGVPYTVKLPKSAAKWPKAAAANALAPVKLRF